MDGAAALRDWQRANGFRVRIPAKPWASSDGYSGAILRSLIVDDGMEARQLIVKLIPPPTFDTFGAEAGREPVRHRRACAVQVDFARSHLVEQPFPALLTSSNQVLMFQSLAANGIDCVSPLGLPSGQLAEICAVVVRELVQRWNRGSVSSQRSTVRSVLAESAGTALAPNATIARWATPSGLFDRTRPWIMMPDDDRVYPNPLLPALQRTPLADAAVDVLRGHIHGDLHVLNVLLPTRPHHPVSPEDFQLVDLATFAESGLLTHDPACLLLSAVVATIDSLPTELWDTLILAILDQAAPSRPGVAFSIAAAVRDAFDESIEVAHTGWSRAWRHQFLLSVQALALVFTSYERLTPRLRWWFFRLSASAARAVADTLGLLRTIPDRAPLVVSPFPELVTPRSPGPLDTDPAVLRATLEHRADEVMRDAAAFSDRAAVTALRSLLERVRGQLGEEDPVTIRVSYHLARRQFRLGDKAPALELLRLTSMRATEVLGAQDPLAELCHRDYLRAVRGLL